MTKPTLFISYSHKNETEKNVLLAHLGVLRRAGLLEIWNDDQIGAGGDWLEEIRQKMAKAQVAILLITADFLNSEFILDEEVPALLERREVEGLVVFPVIAKACAWRKVKWLAEMNVRPKNGKPVWGDRGSHVDEDLAAIAEEVAEIIDKATVAPEPELRTPTSQTIEPTPSPITPSWILEFPKPQPTLPASQISTNLRGFNPFPDNRAEYDLAILFGKVGGFWSRHPTYAAISANFFPEAIVAETGCGRTAFAYALSQIGDVDQYPLDRTLPIIITGSNLTITSTQNQVANAFLNHVYVNPATLTSLNQAENKFLARVLVSGLGADRVRVRLRQILENDPDLGNFIEQASQLSRPKTAQWLRQVQSCLDLLGFKRAILAFDFGPNSKRQLNTWQRNIPLWAEHSLIPKLFVPATLSGELGGSSVRTVPLTWNARQLDQMVRWRFDSLARMTDALIKFDSLFERDLFPEFIAQSQGNPGRLAHLWSFLFNDHLDQTPGRSTFSAENLARAVERLS